MDVKNTDQQSNLPLNSTSNETSQKTINNQKGNFVIAVGVVLLLLIVGGGSYYLGMMNGKSKASVPIQIPNPTNSLQTNPSPTLVPSSKAIPSPKVGFQQYTNDNLRYGFSYPVSDSLYKCPDIPCLSISRISLRVETLRTYELTPNDAKSSLMGADLFCSADGPGGSISCQNDKVEEYTNTLGFKGFKVLRTKTVTGTGAGFPAGTYKDTVYVYLLPEVKKRTGVSDYAGVMLAVDNPSHSNLSELNITGDSFFTF